MLFNASLCSPVNAEGVPEVVESLRLLAVPAVDDPPVGLHQHGGAQVPSSMRYEDIRKS